MLTTVGLTGGLPAVVSNDNLNRAKEELHYHKQRQRRHSWEASIPSIPENHRLKNHQQAPKRKLSRIIGQPTIIVDGHYIPPPPEILGFARRRGSYRRGSNEMILLTEQK